MKAALVSATPAVGDVKANLGQVLDALGREDADLVVFPELFLSGYVVRDEVRHCAQRLDGPVVRELEAACARTGKHLVVGMPRETRQRGVLTNCAILVGPGGLIGHYDKTHLPTFSVFEEDHWFRAGDEVPVFDTPLGRIGLSICYDLFFPEVTKTQALKGADVLVNVSASPSISQRYFEMVLPARAIETTCWLLYVNLAGPQDTLNFWAAPQAWNPRGELVARGDEDVPNVVRVDVDLDVVREARLKRPALRDTRATILGHLVDAGDEA